MHFRLYNFQQDSGKLYCLTGFLNFALKIIGWLEWVEGLLGGDGTQFVAWNQSSASASGRQRDFRVRAGQLSSW